MIVLVFTPKTPNYHRKNLTRFLTNILIVQWSTFQKPLNVLIYDEWEIYFVVIKY